MAKGGTRCSKCQQLLLHSSVKNIQKRKKKPLKNSPSIRQNSVYLSNRSTELAKKIRVERLKMKKQIELVHSFILAIEHSHFSRIPELLRRSRITKMGMKAITDLVIRASKGSYHMRSYSDKIIKVATIVKAYGGRIPLEVLRKQFSDQLPSRTTIWCHNANARIRLSASYPTPQEVNHNLDVFFPMSTLRQTGQRFGVGIDLDELKMAEKFVFDSHTKLLAGGCRRHLEGRDLQLENFEALKRIKGWVDDGSWHVGKYATVMGILVPPLIPLAVSTSCMEETAETEGDMIDTVVVTAREYLKDTGCEVWVINSNDLESFLARDLPLFNYSCSREGILAFIDTLHKIKTSAAWIRSSKVIYIGGIHLSPTSRRQHLRSILPSMSEHSLEQLLDPDDHQNVPKATRLLARLVNISQMQEAPSQSPLVEDEWRAWQLIGAMMEQYYDAFTDLSTFAHLCTVLVNKYGHTFMHPVLYLDILLDISTIFKLAARACQMDSEYQFYIIRLGTDSLGKLFGILRTMVGSDSDCDAIQIIDRASTATLIKQIWHEHPDLQPINQRLCLRSRDGSNHLRTIAVKGDVRISTIPKEIAEEGEEITWKEGLRRAWMKGRASCESILSNSGIPDLAPPWMSMEKAGIDICNPMGKAKLLPPNGGSNDDDIISDLFPSITETPPSPTLSVPTPSYPASSAPPVLALQLPGTSLRSTVPVTSSISMPPPPLTPWTIPPSTAPVPMIAKLSTGPAVTVPVLPSAHVFDEDQEIIVDLADPLNLDVVDEMEMDETEDRIDYQWKRKRSDFLQG
ncbi:hypothetical protein BT69DRAFT_1315014 [Atractiella rhizophila]|nr:hypothetical protein BT69DRAFT_1315014 [Atractiella rhizophila]